MKVVIIGAGEVGFHVIGTLYREGVDILAIDSDRAVLEQLKAEFNISVLEGNATNATVLEQADVAHADLFLAITNNDETNIISCMLAGQSSNARKIARVKTIDIGQDSTFTEKGAMGIDLIINPSQVAAEHLDRLVAHPQVTDYTPFMGERVLLVRFPIAASCPLAGRTVLQFAQSANIPQVLIALVQREGQSFMPRPDTVIEAGDQVYFFCEKVRLDELSVELALPTRPAKRVFINGGGHIGYSLAQRLERRNVDVRILDISDDRCQWLSEHLDTALVLHADGSDSEALRSEGIENADYYLSLTDTDPVNVVSCLLAGEFGAAKTLALTKQPEYIPMLTRPGMIDIAFSPRLLTAQRILRFVKGQNLDSFFAFVNSDIELLELRIQPGLPCDGCTLSGLGLPPGVLVGAVQRGGRIFVPRGDDVLHAEDTILLLQQRRNRRVTRSVFLEGPGPLDVPTPSARPRSVSGA